MGTPIYKISEYIDWNSKSPIAAIYSDGGSVNPPITAGLDGVGTAGQVSFWQDGNTLTGDDGLTYELDSSGVGTLGVSRITGLGDSAGENTELFIYSDNLCFGDGDSGCLPAGALGFY
jgi:hypothetical protein